MEMGGLALTSACQLASELQEFCKLYNKSYSEKLESVLENNVVITILKKVNRIVTGRTKETNNEFIKTFSCLVMLRDCFQYTKMS